MQPLKSEYNPYYQTYIDKSADGNSLLDSLTLNATKVIEFYNKLPQDKLNYSYANGKWTPKDILLHLIDTERIFSYRALRIARQDKSEMVGFEQDDYVVSGKASNRSLEDLLEEYTAVRQSTICLFTSFSNENFKAIGKASGSNISVRAIGHIITGHENHHNQIIEERYL